MFFLAILPLVSRWLTFSSVCLVPVETMPETTPWVWHTVQGVERRPLPAGAWLPGEPGWIRAVNTKVPAWPTGRVLLTIHGDWIPGQLMDGDTRRIRWQTKYHPEPWTLPLTACAGLWTHGLEAEEIKELFTIKPASSESQDTLWLQTRDRRNGTIERLEREQLVFRAGSKPSDRYPWSQIHSLRFDPALARVPKRTIRQIQLTLTDGARLTCKSCESDGTAVRWVTTYGARGTISRDQIAAVEWLDPFDVEVRIIPNDLPPQEPKPSTVSPATPGDLIAAGPVDVPGWGYASQGLRWGLGTRWQFRVPARATAIECYLALEISSPAAVRWAIETEQGEVLQNGKLAPGQGRSVVVSVRGGVVVRGRLEADDPLAWPGSVIMLTPLVR